MTTVELSNMIDLATRLLRSGEPGVLSTLFATNGSSYRPLGSMMVSGVPTMLAGGISGGCLEQYIAREGRSLTQDTPAAMLSFDADPEHDDGVKPVLGCGGSIEVLVERLAETHLEFLTAFAQAQRSDGPSLAACTINVHGDQVSRVSRSWLNHSTQPADVGASQRQLIHYIPPMTRLVIFGAGDDAQPLASIARGLGWHVTVADRRGRLATEARFAKVDQLVSADWPEAISRIKFTPSTAAVLMTHSLVDDIEIVPLLQDKPLGYVGSLGPAHRREWVIDGALQTATLSESLLENFRGPIGLNLGDRTATGIAVSIAAEILAQLNHRSGASLSHPKPPMRAAQNS